MAKPWRRPHHHQHHHATTSIISRRLAPPGHEPGEEGAWIERQRARLRSVRVRALDCLTAIWLATGDHALAVEMATEVVALEPFREAGYRSLMRAHAAAGNRGEALRVYERCRRLLGDELGVDPSPETEAAYLALLG